MEKRLKTFASIMIAIVSILGALSIIQNSNFSNKASSGYSDGLNALRNKQVATISSYFEAYNGARAHLKATYYNNLGLLYWDEAERLQQNGDETGASEYLSKANETWGIATNIEEYFYDLNYINDDGSYNIDRAAKVYLADEAENVDMNSELYFEEAETGEAYNIFVVFNTLIFAFAFFFFMMVGVNKKTWLMVIFNLLGILFTFTGSIFMLLAEL